VRRPLLLAALLSALALTLSACDVSAMPNAARVGGDQIPESSVNALLAAVRDDGALRCVFTAQSDTYSGAGNGNFSSSFTAQQLTDLLQLHLEDGLIAKLGLTRTAFARAAALTQLDSAFSPANYASCIPIPTGDTSPDAEQRAAAKFLAALPPAYRSLLEETETDQVVLDAHVVGLPLTEGGLHSYEQAHTAALTTACLSVILVATEQKAKALQVAIDRGADFASVARANSTDAQSGAAGGAIGCQPPEDLIPPIGGIVAALPTGTVSSPVHANGSWVLFEVTSREGVAQLSDVERALFDAANAQALKAVAAYAKAVGVAVNPAYGAPSIGSSGALVNPPVGPADALLYNPTAVSPTSAG